MLPCDIQHVPNPYLYNLYLVKTLSMCKISVLFVVVEEHGGGIEHLSVSVIPESLTVSAGNVATFRCQAFGFPAPSVQWEKRGGALPPSHIGQY